MTKELDLPQNRAAAALQLRIDGASFADIAKVLEFPTAAKARDAVDRALAAEPSDMNDVERIRALESKRIERILFSLMRRATNPKDPDHLAYATRALAAIKQQSDLFGATAPQKVDVTYTPSAAQLEEWVASVTRLRHGDVEEGDIIDVEEITDGT